MKRFTKIVTQVLVKLNIELITLDTEMQRKEKAAEIFREAFIKEAPENRNNLYRQLSVQTHTDHSRNRKRLCVQQFSDPKKLQEILTDVKEAIFKEEKELKSKSELSHFLSSTIRFISIVRIKPEDIAPMEQLEDQQKLEFLNNLVLSKFRAEFPVLFKDEEYPAPIRKMSIFIKITINVLFAFAIILPLWISRVFLKLLKESLQKLQSYFVTYEKSALLSQQRAYFRENSHPADENGAWTDEQLDNMITSYLKSNLLLPIPTSSLTTIPLLFSVIDTYKNIFTCDEDMSKTVQAKFICSQLIKGIIFMPLALVSIVASFSVDMLDNLISLSKHIVAGFALLSTAIISAPLYAKDAVSTLFSKEKSEEKETSIIHRLTMFSNEDSLKEAKNNEGDIRVFASPS